MFNRLYSRNYNALKAYTQTRYGIDALWVPETMGWDGNARGTDQQRLRQRHLLHRHRGRVQHVPAVPVHQRHRPTCATSPTRTCGRRCGSTRTGSSCSTTSRYYMANSNAHETYWDVRNAITDLAAVRLLAPLTIQVSTQLGLDSGLRAGWQDLVDNLLRPYQVSQRRLAAARPADRAAAQRRERVGRADLAVRPHRHRRAGLPDRDPDLERAAQPVRQRVGQRPRAGGPARAWATRPSTA